MTNTISPSTDTPVFDEPSLRSMLGAAARGDRAAFEKVYDQLSLMTYTACAQHFSDESSRDEAMSRLWLHIWRTAGVIARSKAPVDDLIRRLSTRFARERRLRQPVELLGS